MYTLIDSNGKAYLSKEKGILGGHKKGKIYGNLNCKSASRAIEKGDYKTERVFFRDEKTAINAGYRPCAVCMPEKYHKWKSTQTKN
ncbi:Ada metal-binding domain-containing protein [Pseudogracilibacillus sp. SE30717A]|uniref:Ada metal-binding domain-containing protein n=1 Tax=Pseudogracilibacillus sp. SE30717A TaxID=3098293 RepID=UPI00300E3CB6